MDSVSDYLKCHTCQEDILPPYQICKYHFIVCQNCEAHVDMKKTYPKDCNHCIRTELAQTLRGHCPYECGFYGKDYDVIVHERECENAGRPARCIIGSCEWHGNTKDLVHHVESKHSAQLIALPDYRNQTFRISKTNETLLVVQFELDSSMNHIYWLLLRTIHNKPKLLILNQGRYGPPEANQIVDEIAVYNEDEGLISNNVLKDFSGFLNTRIIDEMVEYMGRTLIILPENETLLVKMQFSGDMKHHFPLKLESTGVLICKDGHRYPFGDSETCRKCLKFIYETETYQKLKLFECDNLEYGCLIKCTKEDMIEHTKRCEYRATTCPIAANCIWVGNHRNLQNHCIEKHSVYKLQKKYRATVLKEKIKCISVPYFLGQEAFTFEYFSYKGYLAFCVYHYTGEEVSPFYFTLELSTPSLAFQTVPEKKLESKNPCRASSIEDKLRETIDFKKKTYVIIKKTEFKNICLGDTYNFELNIYKSNCAF